jgi:hypothetical protein
MAMSCRPLASGFGTPLADYLSREILKQVQDDLFFWLKKLTNFVSNVCHSRY